MLVVEHCREIADLFKKKHQKTYSLFSQSDQASRQ